MQPRTSLQSAFPLFALAPVFATVLVLRAGVHAAFGNDNVSLGFYSRDVYIPLLVCTAIFLDRLNREEMLEMGLQPRVLLPWSVCLVATLAALRFWPWLVRECGNEVPTALLIFAAFALTGASFFCVVSFPAFVRRLRPFGMRWLALIAAVGALFHYPKILKAVWGGLAPFTAQAVTLILRWTGTPVEHYSVSHNIRLAVQDAPAAIGMGCSGFEGVFFFLFGLTVFLVLDRKPIHLARTALTALAGSAFLVLLNLGRISLFLSIAARTNRLTGTTDGSRWATWAFHQNVGWYLYLAGIALFFWALVRLRSRLIEPSPASAPPA